MKDNNGARGTTAPGTVFWPDRSYSAEGYHQKYFDLNPRQGYCQAIIRPKVETFEKGFGSLLEPAAKQ